MEYESTERVAIMTENPALPAALSVFEAINSGDLSCLPDCVTADFVDHGSPIPIPPGPEGYAQILGLVTRVLRVRYVIDDLFSTPERIVARATATGEGTAQFHGPEMVGRPYSMSTIHIFRTEGEKLAEHWGVRDELGAMRRMGAVPEPSLS